jgi:hypothetical protein
MAIDSDNAKRKEVVEMLLQRGADVTLMDVHGYNAAKIASQTRRPDKKIQEMIQKKTPHPHPTPGFGMPVPRRNTSNVDENSIPRKVSNASSTTAPRRFSNPITRPDTTVESPANRLPARPPSVPTVPRVETSSTVLSSSSTLTPSLESTVELGSLLVGRGPSGGRSVSGPPGTGQRTGKVMGRLTSRWSRKNGGGGEGKKE